MGFFTGETFPYAYNLEVMAADPPSVVESHGKQLNCQGVMIRNGAQRILQSAVGQFRKRPNVVSPAFPKNDLMGPIGGGSNLMLKCMVNLRDFPKKNSGIVWVGKYNDPCFPHVPVGLGLLKF